MAGMHRWYLRPLCASLMMHFGRCTVLPEPHQLVEVQHISTAEVVQMMQAHSRWTQIDMLVRECRKMRDCENPYPKHDMASRY